MLGFRQFFLEDKKSFRSWFAGSKVKDSEGKPLVVYHGSPDIIDEFKYEYMGKGNDQLGSGFYFTTDPNEALGYGKNIHKVYLNISKPLDADILGSLTYNMAMSFIKRSPDLIDSLSNWGDVDYYGKNKVMNDAAEEYTFKKENLVRGLFNIANDFYNGYPKEFNSVLKKILGYDGIIKTHPNGTRHYVAFFPYQIKAVENEGTWQTGMYTRKGNELFPRGEFNIYK